MKTIKKNVFAVILVMLFAGVLFIPRSVQALDDVEINEENFPDETFREYVQKEFDLNGDLVLDAEERNAATYIDVTFYDYSMEEYDDYDAGAIVGSLQGIEFFPKLETLNCNNNYIHTLDLSGNPELKSLDCASCGLETINLAKNTKLERLACSFNQLTSLDLSKCTELNMLICVDNKLTTLDISKNTKLRWLGCNYNDIRLLDIHTCKNLVQAYKEGSKSVEQLVDMDKYLTYSCEDDESGQTFKLAVSEGTLIQDELFAITKQPTDQTVKTGEKADFEFTVTGTNLYYQWQWREDSSGEWKEPDLDFMYFNLNKLTVDATLERNGYQFRCVVTDIADKTKITSEVTLTVTKIPISPSKIAPIGDKTFTGSALKPAVTVTLGDKTLQNKTDYEVAYKNNINAGTATVTVTGKGLYTGTAKTTFTINPKPVTPTLTLTSTAYTYDGKGKTPGVTVKDGSTTLKRDTDYTITWPSGRTNAGTYTIKVTLKGNYKGSASTTFKIKMKSLENGTITLSKKAYTYTGKAKKPGTTVVVDGKTLVKNTDYTVAYKNNTNAGKATVIITGKGNYKGTAKATYKIKKAEQPLEVTKTTKSVKYTKVKKETQKVKGAITVTGAVGTVQYKRVSGDDCLTIAKSSGTIKVKKGTAKGTYKIKVKVVALATDNYKKTAKTVTVKIKVK